MATTIATEHTSVIVGTQDKPLCDFETHWGVTQFLTREAELLDGWRYREWAEMITDDFNYGIPVPVTRDDPGRPQYGDETYLVEETKASLDLWVRRYDNDVFEFAWGENPLQRTRRYLSNIRVREGDKAGEYEVRTNEILAFTRQSDPTILTTCLRVDTLRRDGESWRVARRRVYLDQNIHHLTHLRLVF
ncbi:MAG TPA: aromatic-ring-hydroxylating dioxygenase subunit beta [Candidatus Dormibacteraeota bacterium]|jgi:3-phenylpropionate/cinnamic acid dioxygenase small subunit|nr:aromatic-ring-hydroxylating dioxygenase subunit beta [Candidatus Dormibacteraeota bacterium]